VDEGPAQIEAVFADWSGMLSVYEEFRANE
jgi:hypothetical protein